MDQEVLTIAIDRALADKLDQLVRDCETSRDTLLVEAVTRFIDEEASLVAAIKQGEADFEAGRFVTHEQLMEELRVTYGRKDAA